MGLRIRIQDGPEAGRRFEIDDGVAEIRIGRDPVRCDIVLPADDTRVSREHLALRRVLGRYHLVLNGESPVLLDGRRAHDQQVMEPLAELQVGIDGPRLLVEIVTDDSLLPTAGLERGQPGVHTQVRRLGHGLASARRWGKFAVAGVVVALAAGFAGFRLASARMVKAEASLRSFDQKLAEERSETKYAFRRIAQRAMPSVYLVLLRVGGTEAGVVSPAATAWVVGPRTLATNGHVARLVQDKAAGVEVVVRNSLPAPHEARIGRVEIHPGFARFPEFVRDAAAYDQAERSLLSGLSLPACDVALLHLADDESARLGPALEAASVDVARALEIGQDLATLGFPLEGMHKGGVSLETPLPTFQLGSVTGLSGFFLEKEPAEAAHLVQFSMPAVGGSSGSPVFDREGRVVAILNGGNMIGSESGVRIPIAGVNYGQRIDLLRELQDAPGLAASMKAHEARWKRVTGETFRTGLDGLFAQLQSSAERAVGRLLVPVEQRQGVLPTSTEVARAEISFVLPQNGDFAAIAVAEGVGDLDAYVIEGGRTVGLDEQSDHYPIVGFSGQAGTHFQLLLAIPGSPGTVPYRVRFFRVAD